MLGPDGNHVTRMTMEDYAKWQGWDEWPERKDDPPLTVETVFWYEGKEYMVTYFNGKYSIVSQPEFNVIVSSDNFLGLLDAPFLNEKSFKELIADFLFED